MALRLSRAFNPADFLVVCGLFLGKEVFVKHGVFQKPLLLSYSRSLLFSSKGIFR